MTNFSEEYNALYHNDGDHFTDVSFRSRTAASSLPYVGWGDAFFDYDNDTWPDLIAVNGHVYPAARQGEARARRRAIASASCSTTTAATARSRKSRRSSDRC